MVTKNCEKISGNFKRIISVNILGYHYHLELKEIIDIYTDTFLGKYLSVTNCAFTHYYSREILAVDIRKNPVESYEVTVVIGSILLENHCSLLGFVVKDISDLCSHIKVVSMHQDVRCKLPQSEFFHKNRNNQKKAIHDEGNHL